MLSSLVPSVLLFMFASYSSMENVRVVPVTSTPEADNLVVVIQYPDDNDVVTSLPILAQVRVDGYPLGITTEQQRKDEIRACDKGQTIRIMIDDNPYIPLNEDDAPTNAFDNHDYYFEQVVETKIKDNIKQGDHLIRAYPAYSYGESVHGDKTFQASIFSYKTKGITPIDLDAPMITLNEPQGTYKGDQPILLDFMIHNFELSSDGYKIRLSIDNKVMRMITTYQPFYIYGLPKGSHTIKLEVIDTKEKVVQAQFCCPSRVISVR